MAGPSTPEPSSEAERNKLIEEYEHTRRTEQARLSGEQADALRRQRLVRPVSLGVITLLMLYLAFSSPAWLSPRLAPGPSPAEQEASIRLTIYLQAQQLEQFRRTRGRLPATLAEAGAPLPAIRYDVLDGNVYSLRSTTDTAIRYASTDSPHAFLGSSVAVLRPAP